jgi:hypothetical protein
MNGRLVLVEVPTGLDAALKNPFLLSFLGRRMYRPAAMRFAQASEHVEKNTICERSLVEKRGARAASADRS